MIEQTIRQLREMRLAGVIEAFKEQQESSQYSDLTFDERFSLLVDREFIRRKNNKIRTSLRQAQLKLSASLDLIDFEANRKLNKTKILEFANCGWIAQKQNIIITGPTGCGKTFIACALANNACNLALQAKYYRTHEFATEIQLAKADGSYSKLVAKLAKTKPTRRNTSSMANWPRASRAAATWRRCICRRRSVATCSWASSPPWPSPRFWRWWRV